jgi:hypothetical protein
MNPMAVMRFMGAPPLADSDFSHDENSISAF